MPKKDLHHFDYPSSRRLTFDLGRIGRSKHHVKALLEVDVTEARARIKSARKERKNLSFMAWLVKVIADSVALHPEICAVNRPRQNKVTVFEEVDIALVVEKEVKGKRVPLPFVIRDAGGKTIEEIRSEIDKAKTQLFADEGDYVLGKKQNTLGVKCFVSLPQWLRVAVMRCFFMRNPVRMKKTMGTVMVTTTGMIGHTRGWIIPFSMHPLCLALGSLCQKPGIHQNEIKKREILHLTVLVDHDAIDGIPAAQFVENLVQKMERGDGI